MKHLNKIILCCTFLFNACCNVDPQKSEAKKYCFVYCDFTNSMDSLAHAKVIDDAIQIYDSFHTTHSISFFSIQPNPYAIAIFKSQSEVTRLTYATQDSIIKKTLEQKREQLKESLYKACHEVDTTGTCIIKNIQQAIRDCNNLADTNTTFKLIFLSDMLEYCDSINLEDWDIKASIRYKNANNVLDRDTNLITFPKDQDFKIAVVVSARVSSPKNERLDNQLHQDFWERVFKKFEYTGPKIELSSQIPWAKLKDKNSTGHN